MKKYLHDRNIKIISWTYNMNRKNMQENPLLHNVTQLAGGVLLKNVKYFEVMLNIFEFS